MFRIFGESSDIEGKIFNIPENDKFHLSKVIRLKEGETFEAVVGDVIYELIYLDYDCAKILSYEKLKIDDRPKINLFFSILKGDKNDFVLQKCTEIGVDNFYPMNTMRTIPDIKGKEENRLRRWQRIVTEASKQSKGAYIPIVHYPINIGEIQNYIGRKTFNIVPYELEDSFTIKEALETYTGGDINIIIGPEGGFETIEIISLEKLGVKAVSLGEKILRAETASIVTLANIVYELEL